MTQWTKLTKESNAHPSVAFYLIIIKPTIIDIIIKRRSIAKENDYGQVNSRGNRLH